MRKLTIPFVTFALAALAACGSAQSEYSAPSGDAQLASDSNVTPGIFKMYATPKAQIVPHCDVHTRLTLGNDVNGAVATLEQALVGTCKIGVRPEHRGYSLRGLESSCGSRRYVGARIEEAGIARPVSIEITDHRSRVCRDIVPARIIVEETYSDGRVETRYASYEEVRLEISHTGTLVRLMAIGGETTGFGLELDDGRTVELDLATQGFVDLFVAGQRAEISGVVGQVRGVEIPVRDVLTVQALQIVGSR